MNSTVNIFVHAIHKHSKKCLAQKVGNLHVGSLEPILMIQPPFNSSCVDLPHQLCRVRNLAVEGKGTYRRGFRYLGSFSFIQWVG